MPNDTYAFPDAPEPTGTTTPAASWVDGAWGQANGFPLVIVVEEFHQALTDEALVAKLADLVRLGREVGA